MTTLRRSIRTSRCSSPSSAPADAAIRATPPCGSSVAGTSASCASLISSATRPGFRRRWRRLNTIPTARRASRCLSYADGEKRYILQPDGLKVGQKVVSGPEADILVGNALPLQNIPPGTTIHNIELEAGQGRADGALGRWLGAAGGQRRRVRAGEAAFRRDSQSGAGLHGDHRAGGQYRSRETSPSARRDARAGWESVRTTAAFR